MNDILTNTLRMMELKRAVLIVILLTVSLMSIYSQIIENPNSSLKSHETLIVTKVEMTRERTIVYLSIENRIEGGNFCADRSIFLYDSKGRKLNLINSNGIPVCPDTYKFTKIGEKLDFTLTFPPLYPDCDWVDLVEECSENCFSVIGIILDNKLNSSIDNAFVLAEKNEPVNALLSFIKIAEADGLKNQGAAGLLYINIIQLSRETGNYARASEWMEKLKSSKIPRLSQYLAYLSGTVKQK
jgi:hypothetical protein